MFTYKAVKKIAKKQGDHVLVDLKLDGRLKPEDPSKKLDERERGGGTMSSQNLADLLVSGQTYAIGSGQQNDKIYYPNGDLGLFGCVYEAWANHWLLRTRPEDWWFPVACRIATAIDHAAKRTSKNAKKVRDLFVSHEGKENICVDVHSMGIYGVDYNYLFSVFSGELQKRIKVSGFPEAMESSFSTTGPAHKIASQINLMASMQEFFSYEMDCCCCGLRGLEMLGSVEDWESLSIKLEKVRAILKPIEKGLWLGPWLDHVKDVFDQLANTRKQPDHPRVARYWINVLMDTIDTKWVGGGGSSPGTPVDVEAYNGWLVRFLTGEEKIRAEDLQPNGRKDVRQKISGWNQVPMKVTLSMYNPPLTDESTLVAGIVGFKLHKGEGSNGSNSKAPRPSEEHKAAVAFGNRGNGSDDEVVPSVEPHHMWAMLLPPDSPVRV